MSSPRSQFLSGVRAELPILSGVIPFGLIYGVAALSAQLPPSAAMAMSSIIFAGSAQFIAAQLFEQNASAFIVIATVFIVNVRHMLYSASVAPHLAHLPGRWKWLLAYLLTDEAYAVVITRYSDSSEATLKHWYFLGAGLALWTTWQISTALGILLGSQISAQMESLGLDFAIALTFIALVVPAIQKRATAAAALSAGLVAAATIALPYNLGLLLAALTGIAVGLFVEGARQFESTNEHE